MPIDELWTGAGATGAAGVIYAAYRSLRWVIHQLQTTVEDGEQMYERRVGQLAADFTAYRANSQEQIDTLLTRLDNAHKRLDATSARLDLAEAQLTLCRQESADTHRELADTRTQLGRVQSELAHLRGGMG